MKKQLFAPGRMELAGNHTDHQNGRVLAGALDCGIYAQFEANETNLIRIRSTGFKPIEVRIDRSGVRTTEFGTSGALVRGMVCGFRDLGLNVGGFDAVMKSNLPVGGGLSSSAAFSVLVGRILNELFNDSQAQPIVIARTAQEAENKYFGKPCGLQAQLTIALGKTVYIDFKTGEIEPVKADFASMGLTMCLTETGGSHAGLDTSYARIPGDMVYIANLFDKGVLGDVDPEEFRSKGWDPSSRPVRRAMHFFDENERVPKMRDALKKKSRSAMRSRICCSNTDLPHRRIPVMMSISGVVSHSSSIRRGMVFSVISLQLSCCSKIIFFSRSFIALFLHLIGYKGRHSPHNFQPISVKLFIPNERFRANLFIRNERFSTSAEAGRPHLSGQKYEEYPDNRVNVTRFYIEFSLI